MREEVSYGYFVEQHIVLVRPLREQFLVWMTRIKILQSTTAYEGIKMHQSTPTKVLQYLNFYEISQHHRLMKTSSIAVEMSRTHLSDSIMKQTITL